MKLHFSYYTDNGNEWFTETHEVTTENYSKVAETYVKKHHETAKEYVYGWAIEGEDTCLTPDVGYAYNLEDYNEADKLITLTRKELEAWDDTLDNEDLLKTICK
jgi:hypothetical protein